MRYIKSIFCNIGIMIVLISTDVLCSNAAQTNIDFVETKVIDGFFIGVTDELGNTNSDTQRRLYFSIWTTNKIWSSYSTRIVFPVDQEYAYQIKLLDTNAEAVQKTRTGSNVGIKYVDFDPNSFYVPSTGHRSGFGIKAERTVAKEKAWPYEMEALFRPSDLFKIEKPGSYILRINFQIIAFPRTNASPGAYKTDLIRFPPLDYPIVNLNK